MNKTERIVFIDWFGTLSCDLFWQSLAKRDHAFIQETFLKQSPIVDAWMVGAVNTKDVCEQLKQITRLESSFLEKNLQASCEQMSLSRQTQSLLQQLQKTALVVLVTDNMDCFSLYTGPRLKKQGLFDLIINSADVRRLKCSDNGRTFRETAARYEIPLSQCFLIDDSEKTCAQFEKIGGIAYRTSGLEQTQQLLKKLTQEQEDAE
jgi:FMN phosphatase YigB (HAD superfamily)